MADGLGSVVNMLSPLDDSGAKWRSWGETMSGVVASGVNLVISGISKLIGFLGRVVSKATAAGSAIKGMFGSGGAGPAKPVPLAGARALGGPVAGGKPYLVGERGPKLFVPGSTGRIETHGALRRMTENGTAASAGIENRTSQRAYSITNNWTINGADDPRAVTNQIDSRFSELMRQLESEQRGFLSD
jgi:phage-related minor tail protein